MRSVLHTLLLALFFLVSALRAQELTPVFENITEGLPSTEVHDIFQDSIGYMWFATDRGICRYNGDEMKIVDTDKDINTNVFFKFFKETETRVWLLTKNHTLYWFNPFDAKPKFRPHPKNDQIQSMIQSSKYHINISDVRFNNGAINLLFRRAPGYFHVPKVGNCFWRYPQEGLFDSIAHYLQLEIKTGDGFHYTQFNRTSSSSPAFSVKINKSTIQSSHFAKQFLACDHGISAELKTKKGVYLSVSEQLFRIHNDEITFVNFPHKILCILESKENIYIGTYGGVFVCDYQMNIKGYFLKGKCVTQMIEDREHNFWVSTVQSGVYKSENLQINGLKFEFEFENSGFLPIGKNLFLHDEIRLEGLMIDTNNQLTVKMKNILLVGDRVLFDNPNYTIHVMELSPLKWDIHNDTGLEWKYGFIRSPIDYTHVLIDRMICKIDGERIATFSRLNRAILPTFCIEKKTSSLVVGSLNGLYDFNLKTKKLSETPIRGSKNKKFYSAATLSGKIIMTSDKGIHYYSENKLHRLPQSEKLHAKSIYKRNEKEAWIWNDHSIYKLSIRDGRVIVADKIYYSTKSETTINSIIEFNNKLWVSTKKGIQVIDINEYRQKRNEKNFLFIPDSLLIDAKKWSDLSTLSLTEGNTMRFFFNSICYDRSVNRKLEYSINGDTWFEASQNSIVLSSLSDGDYALRIRRVEEPSNILFSIPIHVSKIWYQSNWFITLSSFLVLILIVLVIIRYFKARDKKRSLELDKLNLELKLLTSKMNPHFTFNTINSIQYYILKSDKKEAIQYLSDFALLIRKSLEFSMEERIKIEEEMHFLSLYVKLENKRFDSNFLLKFDCDLSENRNKKIPSMLIQPLVENIILHAGYTEEDEKIIQISIKSNDGFFIIQIIDFGKGIVQKDELNKHKSYGIDILRSRVKIYNGLDYKASDVSIQSTPNGTTVTLKLKEWKQ